MSWSLNKNALLATLAQPSPYLPIRDVILQYSSHVLQKFSQRLLRNPFSLSNGKGSCNRCISSLHHKTQERLRYERELARLTHEWREGSEVHNGIFLLGDACQLAKENGRLEKCAVELWMEKKKEKKKNFKKKSTLLHRILFYFFKPIVSKAVKLHAF